jgi:ubiquinone biosynthesis UbiH/UbiF/VisC/COQ6 family hydroxylase
VALVLALLLARAGRPVVLPLPDAQREPADGAADIRAYALNDASRRLLSDLKVWRALPASAICAVQHMRVFGDRPGAALHFSAYQCRVPALAHIVDAAALTQALHQAVQFTPGVRFEPFPPVANPVAPDAVLTTLQVWADGRRGADHGRWLRQRGLNPLDDEQRDAYGHVAIATRLRGCAHQHTAWQWFGGQTHQQDVLALLPTAEPDAWGLVWSVPQAQAQTLLALDDEAFARALNDSLQVRCPAALTPAAPWGLRPVAPRQGWPLAQARLRQWAGPGWVVAGDAAHVVHPLAGQGLNLGLADAACLARVLSEPADAWRPLGDPVRLAWYERERLAAVATMQGAVDGLWQLFALPGPLAAGVRTLGLALFEQAAPLKRWAAAQAFG